MRKDEFVAIDKSDRMHYRCETYLEADICGQTVNAL